MYIATHGGVQPKDGVDRRSGFVGLFARRLTLSIKGKAT